jgi:hypothetical protein
VESGLLMLTIAMNSGGIEPCSTFRDSSARFARVLPTKQTGWGSQRSQHTTFARAHGSKQSQAAAARCEESVGLPGGKGE